MIFYFSGTGNSYAAAKTLADGLGESLTDIAKAIRENAFSYTLEPGEKLGFVFPVYAWAPPQAVTDFIKKIELYFPQDPYTFAVCTCGASAGDAMSVLEASLESNGLSLDSGFSLLMPDNYVAGFDVEPKKEQQEKLLHAKEILQLILRAVTLERKNFFRVKRGKNARFLTNVVNLGFRHFATRTKPFYVTKGCIGCGLCETVCTDGCISMAGGRPVWTKDRCNMCLACLNRCPTASIQYGKKTEKRGRYVHPSYENGGEGREFD